MKIDLEQQYKKMALACYYAGLNCDDKPGGSIHNWLENNVEHRLSTAFYIVLGINCELATLLKQPEPPKYIAGQLRLFEPFNPYMTYGTQFVLDPRYGKTTD